MIRSDEQVFPGASHRVRFVFHPARSESRRLCVVFADAAPDPRLQYVEELGAVDAHRLFVLDDFGPYAGDEGYPGCWYLGERRGLTFAGDVSALVAHAAAVVGTVPGEILAAGRGKGGFAALHLALRNGWGRVVAGSPHTRLGRHLTGELGEVAAFVAGGTSPADRRWLNGLLLDAVRTARRMPEVEVVVGRDEPAYGRHVLPLLEALQRRTASARPVLVDVGDHPEAGATAFGVHLLDRLIDSTAASRRELDLGGALDSYASRWSRRSRATVARTPDGLRCFAPAVAGQEGGVYAGLRFDAEGFEMLRVELTIRRPHDIDSLLVDAEAAGRGIGRWQWVSNGDRPLARGRTTLLLSRSTSPPITARIDGDLGDTDSVEVFVRLKENASADLVVHRVELIGPAEGAQPEPGLPLPVPADAAASSRGLSDPASVAKRVAALAARGEFPPRAALPAGRTRRPELKVACLLDRFSELGFRPEFDYIDFTPDDYRETIDRERPDMLLVESIWRGKDETWNKLMVPDMSGGGPAEPVRDLVAHCRALGIPTVFWNKEDPPNFEHFIETAVLFDHIFTTDESVVARYVAAAGHDRVGVLPFAAQPMLHNPVGAPVDRPLDVAFLGTFYGRKHAARKRQMEMILDPARDFGVHIYSRVAATAGYAFPDKYQAHLIGTVPYEQVLGAYRSYKVLLNVNSAPDSRTMCARRVFEILACGGTVLSGPSPAIEAVLGAGVVHESDSYGHTRDVLAHVLSNEPLRERRALEGMRRVLAAHTYEHRVDAILAAVGISARSDQPTVTLVAPVRDADEARTAVRIAVEQSRPPEQLVLVTAGPAPAPGDLGAGALRVDLVEGAASDTGGDALGRAAHVAAGDLVGVLSPAAMYGVPYLEDLLNAVGQTRADVVGKAAHYVLDPGRAWMMVADREQEHRHVAAVRPEAMLVRRPLLDRVRLRRGERLEAWLERCASVGVAIYAADRFNFAGVGDPLATADVEARGTLVESFGPGARHAIA